VIAMLAFAEAGPRGVRRATFVRRPRIPLDAACVVANGVRESLRGMLGEACSVAMGEPVAIDAAAWTVLIRDALVFATPGRATDVAFVLGRTDARTLVDAAFGEEGSHRGAWSTLEHGAVERIVARCASACDVLCAERRGPTHAADAGRLPPCVAFFDVRVTAPVRFTLGVGLLRELPEPASAATLAPAALAAVPLTVQVILGTGQLSARRLLELRPGDLVALGTKVADEGELNVAGQRVAGGICGAVRGRAAFIVRSLPSRGDA
jgi:flagellar motor switch/type III secretory pathway protein FliN